MFKSSGPHAHLPGSWCPTVWPALNCAGIAGRAAPAERQMDEVSLIVTVGERPSAQRSIDDRLRHVRLLELADSHKTHPSIAHHPLLPTALDATTCSSKTRPLAGNRSFFSKLLRLADLEHYSENDWPANYSARTLDVCDWMNAEIDSN
jgi:hypothetical protein